MAYRQLNLAPNLDSNAGTDWTYHTPASRCNFTLDQGRPCTTPANWQFRETPERYCTLHADYIQATRPQHTRRPA